MGTDKGENFEVESHPYVGQGDRSPLWLAMGILMVAGMVFGGYVYHVDRPGHGQPRLTLPASAGSIPDSANNRDDQRALPAAGQVPASTYDAPGNSSASSGSTLDGGQAKSSTY